MADISDVEAAMVQIIAANLGASAPYLPPAPIAFGGNQVRVARGWPTAADLDAALKAGISTVTVFPVKGMVRTDARYAFQWHAGTPVAPTLTATVAGLTVTFGGTGSGGQVAGVSLGDGEPRAAYAYALADADTPEAVATALAAMIPGASASGVALTVPNTAEVTARVMVPQPAWLETRRQDQAVMVTVWSPSPQARDVVASAVDAGFANMQDQWGRQTEFAALPDGSNAWIRYAGNDTDDVPQQAKLWRRTLRYRVEYATTLLQAQPEALFIGGPLWTDGVFGNFGDVEPSTSVIASDDGNSVFVDAAGNIVGVQPTD